MFNSINDILDFAMEKEAEAVDYYNELAERMSQPATRNLFGAMAKQEQEHLEKLRTLRKDDFLKTAAVRGDLSMFTGFLAPSPGKELKSSDLSYQNALMLALEREESARKLYVNLAEIVEDEDLQGMFLTLAQEETLHHQDILAEYRKQTS